MKSLLIVLSVIVPGTALASSPGAWDALFRRATDACLRRSELKSAKVTGQPLDFRSGVLVIVSGRWPQPHMKNARARFACLFDKTTGEAEAQELGER